MITLQVPLRILVAALALCGFTTMATWAQQPSPPVDESTSDPQDEPQTPRPPTAPQPDDNADTPDTSEESSDTPDTDASDASDDSDTAETPEASDSDDNTPDAADTSDTDTPGTPATPSTPRSPGTAGSQDSSRSQGTATRPSTQGTPRTTQPGSSDRSDAQDDDALNQDAEDSDTSDDATSSDATRRAQGQSNNRSTSPGAANQSTQRRRANYPGQEEEMDQADDDSQYDRPGGQATRRQGSARSQDAQRRAGSRSQQQGNRNQDFDIQDDFNQDVQDQRSRDRDFQDQDRRNQGRQGQRQFDDQSFESDDALDQRQRQQRRATQRDDAFQQDDAFSGDRDQRDAARDASQQRENGRQRSQRVDVDSEANADVDLGASLEMNDNDQLVVSSLTDSGLFAGTGIREGDVLLSLGGRTFTSPVQVQRWLMQANPGQRIPAVILRDGQRRTVYLDGLGRFSGSAGLSQLGVVFDADPRGRLIVSDIGSNGLLVDSGLRPGDVVIQAGGRPIASQTDFIRIYRNYNGDRFPVVVMRDGQRETIYVSTTDNWQGDDRGDFYAEDVERTQYGSGRAWLGVYLDSRYPDRAVVEAVQVGSAADEAGLQAGDWILGVNGQRVRSSADLSRVVAGMQPGEELELDISRRVTRDVFVQLGERPSNLSRFRYDEQYDTDAVTGRPAVETYQQRGYRGDISQPPYIDRPIIGDGPAVIDRSTIDDNGVRDAGPPEGTIRDRIRDRRGR